MQRVNTTVSLMQQVMKQENGIHPFTTGRLEQCAEGLLPHLLAHLEQ